MFYHPNDSKFTMITKHVIFWTGLLTMFGLFIFLIQDDARVPQREIVMRINMKDKVNICLPEDEKIFKI